MNRALLSIAIHLYGAAAVVYLTYLIRQFKVLPVAGRVLVGVGLVLHAASVGLSIADTAKVLGKREGNIKALQHKAVAKLQKMLVPGPDGDGAKAVGGA